MTRVVRLLILGLLLLAQPQLPHGEQSDPDCFEPEQPYSGAKNFFVANDQQLCRPFVPSDNAQVVRVISLVATPGPNDTVVIQAQTCTGVVIGPRTVLTAKHCFETDTGEGRVIAGFVKTITPGLFPIRLRSPDPQEDIMMLTVSEPMGIQPALIAPKDVELASLSLQGYGCLHETAELPFTPGSLPLQRSGTARYVIDNILYMSGCICHGDSGGPVFDAQGRLVALMIRTDNQGMAGRGLMVHRFLNAP